MPIANYGVLKGTVVGHDRDADDNRYRCRYAPAARRTAWP